VQNPYFLAFYPQVILACYRKLIDKFMAHGILSQGSVRLLANIKTLESLTDPNGLQTTKQSLQIQIWISTINYTARIVAVLFLIIWNVL